MCSGILPGEAFEEEWRVVPSYPTIKVSSVGRVIGPRGVLRGTAHKTLGYVLVAAKSKTLYRKQDQLYVHRLVAEAFLGPCPEKHEVNHINGRRDDNRVTNLEYVTRLGNIRHAQGMGTFINPPRRTCDKHHMARLTNEQALEVRALAATHTTWELCEKFGVGQGSVNRLLRGETYVEITGGKPVEQRKRDAKGPKR